MARQRSFSPQTVAVLRLLAQDPSAWRHGYDIAREAGLKSGTLYPILIRLAERGLLDARWEQSRPGGRPPRHSYRLTDEGVRRAAALGDTEGDASAGDHGRRLIGHP